MMNTTSGRDKMCALLQYIIELYQITLQNKGVSSEYDLRKIKVCKRIVRSISSSRKMLRFMKFIEGIRKSYKYYNEIVKEQYSKIQGGSTAIYIFKVFRDTLTLFAHIHAIFFYFFDGVQLELR